MAMRPPSTISVWPTTMSEAGDARYSTAPTISSGLPTRPAGMASRIHARYSGSPSALGDHRRVEVARPDRVDVHAVLDPLRAECARQLDDGALARAVGGLLGDADHAVGRREVDDLAAAALDHLPADRLAEHEGDSGVQEQHAVPRLLGGLLARVALEDPRGVDEDVDRPAVQGARRQLLRRTGLEQVGDLGGAADRLGDARACARRRGPTRRRRRRPPPERPRDAAPSPLLAPVTSARLPSRPNSDFR